MSEVLATREEIKKLYSLIRRCGIDPRLHTKKIIENKGLKSLNELTHTDMAELIAQFKYYKKNSEAPNTNPEKVGEKERVEELEVVLDRVDSVFRKCIAKAGKVINGGTSVALTEEAKFPLIIEIAKLYFEEVKEVAKVVKE